MADKHEVEFIGIKRGECSPRAYRTTVHIPAAALSATDEAIAAYVAILLSTRFTNIEHIVLELNEDED